MNIHWYDGAVLPYAPKVMCRACVRLVARRMDQHANPTQEIESA